MKQANDRSSIDITDMIKIMRAMITTMTPEAALSVLDDVEKRIENDISTYLKFDFLSTPTIEEPWTLTVHGNDDMSYTSRFASIDDALSFADEMERNPTGDFVQSKMCFTN